MVSRQRFEIAIVAAVVIVAAVYFVAQMYPLVGRVNDKHSDLGLLGWSLIVLWAASAFAIAALVTSAGIKRKRPRSYLEGLAASALYIFVSLVLFLLAFGKP